MATTATTQAAVYQVSATMFRPNDGEYFVAYYATSIAAAQKMLVAIIEAEGWKTTDYEVANWNGTSTSTIRKAVADSGFYSLDCGHGNGEGKPRVLAYIEPLQDASTGYRGLKSDRLAFAKECATALAAGEFATITAREIRLKLAYPKKATTTTTEPETTTTETSTETMSTPYAPATLDTLKACAYATLNVHPESPYAKYNGQRLEVKEVLLNNVLALVIPNNNGNTADFNGREYTDYTPANVAVVDFGSDMLNDSAKQEAGVQRVNEAVKAKKLVAIVAPGEAPAQVVKAFTRKPNRLAEHAELFVYLKDVKGAVRVYSWEKIVIEEPAPYFTSCQVQRTTHVRSHFLNLTTGEQTGHGSSWVDGPCDTPLFTLRETLTGKCNACHSGWAVPGNYPTGTTPPTE